MLGIARSLMVGFPLLLMLMTSHAAAFRMLVAYSDPIGKDAWSRAQEEARSQTHRSLVLEGYHIDCNLFQSYSPENLTKLFIPILENETVDLIVFTSSKYIDTIANLSALYPSQKMMNVGGPLFANTVNIGTRGFEAFYLAGRACGRVTKTGSVGMVSLSGSRGIANAVYVGLIQERPDSTLTLMYSKDYYNPPVERATASYLVDNYNVDCGISQSLYANDQWGNGENIWVVGVAADYRYEVNENVLFSVVYNWEYFYQMIARSILNGTFVGHEEYLGGFDNVMELSTFSTLATNDLERYIVEHQNAIANGTEQVFCGEFADFFPRTSNASCLTLQEIRAMAKYYNGINNPRNLTSADIQERLYVQYGDPLGITVLILNGLVMVLAIATIIDTMIHRNAAVIRSAAYIFCLLVLLGVVIGALSSYFWLGEPSDAFCLLRPWLGGLGFSISFGGLIVKNYRIWRIFSDKSLDTKVADTDRSLILKGILPMLGLEVVILVLWTTLDPLRVVLVTDSPFLNTNQVYISCRSVGIWPVIIFFLPKGILLLGGIVVSYKTRSIKHQFKQYKESREIGWCILVTVLFAIFIMMVNFVIAYNLLAEVGSFTIAIFVVCASLLSFAFGPKLWRLHIQGDKGESSHSTSNRNTSSLHHTENSVQQHVQDTNSNDVQSQTDPFN